MNSQRLIQLVAKDARTCRGQWLTLWILLGLRCTRGMWGHWAHGLFPGWDRGEAGFLVLLGDQIMLIAIIALMVALLVWVIHEDHPRDAEAYLHTRPVSRMELALGKALAWSVLAAAPAVLGFMLRAYLLRNDFERHAEGVQALGLSMMIFGFAGPLSVVAVRVRTRRPALGISILVLLLEFASPWFLVMTLNWIVPDLQSWEPRVEPGLFASRMFTIWMLLMGLGYGVSAGVLMRWRGWVTWVLLAAGLLLCVWVYLFWPIRLWDHEGWHFFELEVMA